MGCGGTGERGLSHGPSRCAPGGAAGRGGSADWRGGGRGCEEPFPSGCAGRVGASLPAAPPARDTQKQGLFFAPGTVATLGTRSLNAGGDVIPSCSTSSCLGLFQRSTGAYESSSSVMQPVPGCPKHCPDAPEWVSASKAAPATVGPADSSAGSPSSLCCTLPPGNHVGVELLLLLQRDSAHLGIKGLCIPFQILAGLLDLRIFGGCLWGYGGSPDVAVQMALLLTRMADICILQHFRVGCATSAAHLDGCSCEGLLPLPGQNYQNGSCKCKEKQNHCDARDEDARDYVQLLFTEVFRGSGACSLLCSFLLGRCPRGARNGVRGNSPCGGRC